jgi:HAD superfamily hydrolase (TIGR01509 family)
MAVGAVFFDVGDTLVEGWAPRDKVRGLMRDALVGEYGARDWYERFFDADIEPQDSEVFRRTDRDDQLRQQTLRWYEDWFKNAAVGIDDVDLDRVRSLVSVPLDLVSALTPGAAEALRWCKAHGLRVALVTNTLSRGDAEVWEDWRRFGLADAIDAVASSHSVGWRKPHPAIFQHALDLTGARPEETVMVGDRLDADVAGAQALGMRAVLRRTIYTAPQDASAARPDATVDSLTELPAILERWLAPISSSP